MKNENAPDNYIIDSILQGDADSYREIVNRYQNLVFSIGMRFFKNLHDAMDFLQEVFLRAYNSISTYKGRAPFKFWLVKIAYNYGINRVRTEKKENIIPEQLPAPESGPEQRHFTGEIKDILLGEIEKLPENYRVCLDLYFFSGMTYGEISSITGIPVNTIKSNVLRAKQVLRNALKGTIAEDYHEM